MNPNGRGGRENINGITLTDYSPDQWKALEGYREHETSRASLETRPIGVTDRRISELQCEIDILAVSNATTTVSREVSLYLTWLLLGTKAVTPPHTHKNCSTALSSIRAEGGDTVPGEVQSREL